VQRINLTTALGTSLVTRCRVDEPSIGLHRATWGADRRDEAPADAGKTAWSWVEHDPQIMFAADRILDMGPGPGERGGEITFFGSPEKLKQESTITAQYFSGRKKAAKCPTGGRRGSCLTLEGAASTTSRNINVRLPLERLVCVTASRGSAIDARAGRPL